MTPAIKDCNCGNCEKQSTSRCPMDWDGFHGNSDKLTGFNAANKTCGCLSHPLAREVLMADVVRELVKKQNEATDVYTSAMSYGLRMTAKGKNLGFTEAISLIRNGVK